MRIHTNTATAADIQAAATYAANQTGAPVYIDALNERGSRSHRQAFEVRLSSDGTRSKHRVNPGKSTYNDGERPYAASWDQWGHFLGYLFALDPTIKEWADANANAFHTRTGNAFRRVSLRKVAS